MPSDPEPTPLVSEPERIPKGMSNVGIIRHGFPIPEAEDEFSLVEKRLDFAPRFRREFDICRQIMALSRAGLGTAPLPQVIAALRTSDHYLIVMANYRGVGALLDDPAEHGRLIARAVAAFHALPLDIPPKNETEVQISRNRTLPFADRKHDALRSEILEFCETPAPPHPDDRLVLCHNDVHFGNIATTRRGRTNDITFLDPGMVAENHIGADFLHFLRSTMIGLRPAAMLDAMLDEYARLTGTDETVLALNMHRYGLLRQLGRLHRFGAKSDRKAVAREYRVGRNMLGTARKLHRRASRQTARATKAMRY